MATIRLALAVLVTYLRYGLYLLLAVLETIQEGKIVGLIQFLIICLMIGLIDWLLLQTPIPAQIIRLFTVIVLIFILLSAMGIFGLDVPIPRVR